MKNTSGHFGSSKIFDNPSEQKAFDDATQNLYQDRPIPAPYARINLSLLTPEDWGPSVFGHKILGGWTLNTTFDWQDGYWTTYDPKNVASKRHLADRSTHQKIDFSHQGELNRIRCNVHSNAGAEQRTESNQ